MNVKDGLSASLYLEAALVALAGAVKPEHMSDQLRDTLADFGMTFGAALRLEPALRDPVKHAQLRQKAERVIEDLRAEWSDVP